MSSEGGATDWTKAGLHAPKLVSRHYASLRATLATAYHRAPLPSLLSSFTWTLCTRLLSVIMHWPVLERTACAHRVKCDEKAQVGVEFPGERRVRPTGAQSTWLAQKLGVRGASKPPGFVASKKTIKNLPHQPSFTAVRTYRAKPCWAAPLANADTIADLVARLWCWRVEVDGVEVVLLAVLLRRLPP